MAELLYGAPVADAISEKGLLRSEALRKQGISPTLAIIRLGERPDDMSYERGAVARCGKAGVDIRSINLPEDCEQDRLVQIIQDINQDPGVHGCLLLRPLPPHMYEQFVCNRLSPEKDVDCITVGSLAGVFAGLSYGFAPCTAEAVIRLLDYYEVPIEGANIVVIGRSLVIGKPVAMLLLERSATVTICHTRTKKLSDLCKRADIIVTAAGASGSIRAEHVSSGQTIIDVGINWDPQEERLVGDVLFEEVEPVVSALTPVPRGVGAITSAVLADHVIEAAIRLL